MITPACTSKDDVKLPVALAATDVCARRTKGRRSRPAEKGHSGCAAVGHGRWMKMKDEAMKDEG